MIAMHEADMQQKTARKEPKKRGPKPQQPLKAARSKSIPQPTDGVAPSNSRESGVGFGN